MLSQEQELILSEYSGLYDIVVPQDNLLRRNSLPLFYLIVHRLTIFPILFSFLFRPSWSIHLWNHPHLYWYRLCRQRQGVSSLSNLWEPSSRHRVVWFGQQWVLFCILMRCQSMPSSLTNRRQPSCVACHRMSQGHILMLQRWHPQFFSSQSITYQCSPLSGAIRLIIPLFFSFLIL